MKLEHKIKLCVNNCNFLIGTGKNLMNQSIISSTHLKYHNIMEDNILQYY